MKIVYKKSIIAAILEASIEAKKEGEQIDYIEVTKDEEKELKRAINALDLIDSLTVKEYPHLTVWGVKIKVEGADD